MTVRPNQPSDHGQDPAAARLARRLEREYRARAERKRAIIIIMASLACVGALLLGIGGIVIAAQAGNAPEKVSTASLPDPLSTPATEPVAAEITEEAAPDEVELAAVAPVDEPEPEPAPAPAKPAKKPSAKKSSSTQRFTIGIGDAGYEPFAIRASSDSPITLTVEQGEGCAAGFTIPSLGISEDNSTGPVTIKLGTLEAGTYRYACAMDMVEGQLVVE